MNEYRMRRWEGILSALWFIFCMWLIINGQREISWFSLLNMLLGVGGLLVLLFLYNMRFNRVDKH